MDKGENNSISESSDKIPKEYHSNRGRLDLGITGGIFRPYSLITYAGEDIIKKISLFCWSWSINACIVSAVGSVASVTIFHTGSRNEKELSGAFRIVDLTGDVSMAITPGVHDSHRLKITLADDNCFLFGGYVCGTLVAATNVQVMLFAITPLESELESGLESDETSQDSSSTIESPETEIEVSKDKTS